MLFHFEPTNTVHGSFVIKVEIAFVAFTRSGYVKRYSKAHFPPT